MIDFRSEKEPDMKFFDFGSFQILRQILSHDKIIFDIVFGAFHITSRSLNNLAYYHSLWNNSRAPGFYSQKTLTAKPHVELVCEWIIFYSLLTMACNSSSVNVSISFHADKISSIIVLYGSPFPIHKLTKVMMTHESKPLGSTTY